MAIDHLCPRDDEYLSPAEIVDRLKREFRFVTVDKERGYQGVVDLIAWLEELKIRGKTAGPVPIDEQIALYEAMKDEVLDVIITDDEHPGDAVLSTSLQPSQRISFGYYSANNQEASRPLLERCATALNYELCEE